MAQTAFTILVLRRRGGIIEETLKSKNKSMTARTYGLWYPAALVLPLVFAGLAAAGYSYTALMLESHYLLTILLVLGAVLLHALVCRWLIVSQTKLALKLALEKRQNKARSEEGQEPDAAKVAAKENLEEIDVEEIQEQTLELLRAFVGLLLVVGCWLVWAEVLPALGILNDVTIWHRTVVVEGQETFEPVTLASLGLAILFAGLTVLSAKNLPGFLEIAVLQRLRVEAGTRYATRTISNYLIVAIGIVLVCNTLGIGWPSVQWLVAALSVGLGFGLQEIFANFVSGLIILLERPVRVGDTVTVGTISGVVTRIKMRTTTITDWNRKELIVPNKSFITSELINWSLSDPILRMDFIVGLEYGSNTTLAHQVMVKVAKEHPLVLDKPEPTVFFKDFGDNSLNFEVRVFVSEATNTGRTRVIHDLHMAIDQAFREHDIVIAFPQRDLHLKTADAIIRVAQVEAPPPNLPPPPPSE